MTERELENKLRELLALGAENEVVEFKRATTQFDIKELGEYFSALSNEANLKRAEFAWLVFGIEDKTHKILGTKFRLNSQHLQALKREISEKTSNGITFVEIHELNTKEGRVILFQIPPAPKGLPIAYDGHYFGRNGESVVALNIEKIERIRSQSNLEDWSAAIVPDATIEDLDADALIKARIEFAKRNPKYKTEVSSWNDAKFLDKAKLTIKGKVTRTALILLGKEESEHFLGSTVKIRWKLKTITNADKGGEVFSIPLILAVDEVFRSIRNLKYVYLRDGTLFPDEFLRYEPFTIRESLNNAIAHQDYSKKGYINVVEFEDDHLVFSNCGTFLPQSVEDVVLRDTPEENYRNPFLVAAMKNLDMVESQGGGICKIFKFQYQRFFPLPDYDFSDSKCKVTITGKILNEDFAKILIGNPDLSLADISLLDKVQKQKQVNDEEFKHLKKCNFIEGRKGNIFLSYKVVEALGNSELKAEYISNLSFDDSYFKDMILKYIKKYRGAERDKLDNLIMPKLSAILNENQKKRKVGNFLLALRSANKIKIDKNRRWILVEI